MKQNVLDMLEYLFAVFALFLQLFRVRKAAKEKDFYFLIYSSVMLIVFVILFTHW